MRDSGLRSEALQDSHSVIERIERCMIGDGNDESKACDTALEVVTGGKGEKAVFSNHDSLCQRITHPPDLGMEIGLFHGESLASPSIVLHIPRATDRENRERELARRVGIFRFRRLSGGGPRNMLALEFALTGDIEPCLL